MPVIIPRTLSNFVMSTLSQQNWFIFLSTESPNYAPLFEQINLNKTLFGNNLCDLDTKWSYFTYPCYFQR